MDATEAVDAAGDLRFPSAALNSGAGAAGGGSATLPSERRRSLSGGAHRLPSLQLAARARRQSGDDVLGGAHTWGRASNERKRLIKRLDRVAPFREGVRRRQSAPGMTAVRGRRPMLGETHSSAALPGRAGGLFFFPSRRASAYPRRRVAVPQGGASDSKGSSSSGSRKPNNLMSALRGHSWFPGSRNALSPPNGSAAGGASAPLTPLSPLSPSVSVEGKGKVSGDTLLRSACSPRRLRSDPRSLCEGIIAVGGLRASTDLTGTRLPGRGNAPRFAAPS
ncbi:hypothetical protein HPB48_001882 [Haemaphysalis longicornis]|uniref:Uncharacterized protein n=1 Tax=Haemaphysalis longicornis TaxID=44386 RepID=A0A9J6G441_HAELO|nr:hypothetical protein HPB48_001882 [Haemaphysalis longicornis]